MGWRALDIHDGKDEIIEAERDNSRHGRRWNGRKQSKLDKSLRRKEEEEEKEMHFSIKK